MDDRRQQPDDGEAGDPDELLADPRGAEFRWRRFVVLLDEAGGHARLTDHDQDLREQQDHGEDTEIGRQQQPREDDGADDGHATHHDGAQQELHDGIAAALADVDGHRVAGRQLLDLDHRAVPDAWPRDRRGRAGAVITRR